MPTSHKKFTPPTVPQNLGAVSQTPNGWILVTWDASSSVSRTVDGYIIYRDAVEIDRVDSPTTQYLDTTIASGTIYKYTVRAYDDLGRLSSLTLPPVEEQALSSEFLMELTPIDQVTSNTIYCNAPFWVDWGNGTPVHYGAGNVGGVATAATISVGGGFAITQSRLITDTFSAADMVNSGFITSLAYFAKYPGDTLEFLTFAMDDASKVANMEFAFTQCRNMTSFPALNTTSTLTNMYTAFSSCNALTAFPFMDTSGVTTMARCWSSCNNMTSFPLLDTGNVTTFWTTWLNCSSLTSFPAIDSSSSSNFWGTWVNCTGLTSFPLISVAGNLNDAWRNCSSLTTMPAINFGGASTMNTTWELCTGLTNMPDLNTPNCVLFDHIFNECTNLVCIDGIQTTNAPFNDAFEMFKDCPALTAPNAAEIILLETTPPGYSYTNSGSCP